jgi:hypothetical protein
MATSRSLSGLKNRSEKVAGRGQILTNSQANSRSIGQEGGEIWILGNTNANDAREFVARLPELLRQNGCDAIISAVGA